jgi:hypothetical protein
MQFVADGPDVPDELLQAHEEGRVVFFCGAGISYPAGLPGFKGLVEKIYSVTGAVRSPIEQGAFENGQFDAMLDLLERRIAGQRKIVRGALAKALKPNLRLKGATDTHAALLTLARTRVGALRLVTTNFDRIFDTAAKRTGQKFQTYSAPMLPIPKKSRWDGLVYLHGLLPKTPDDAALNRLVITSGDFGLAYLTERWAARFVSELFRNYVVCFVGYSINDPVLRYMMDALAADRMLGEITPQAWAFGDCEAGRENQKTIEWEAKGVTPVLYDVPAGTYDHSALHKTLQAWGATYRDGVTGKERIVITHALARPSASTRQDDFVGRMLWALSDKTGLPARQFADFNPTPSLDWLLNAFSQQRFKHTDLNRFGVMPRYEVDLKLIFNLIDRPTPYSLAPRMRLIEREYSGAQWDEVMFQLSRWLARHLNDPQLILWITKNGGLLHERFSSLIEERLNELARLEQTDQKENLEQIRKHAPNAIPSPSMRLLWRLLISGRIKSPWRNSDLYRWHEQFKREGMTTLLRFSLRGLLTPKVAIKAPIFWDEESETIDEVDRPHDPVDWELVLACDHVQSTLADFNGERWKGALPLMLEDFQQLLVDALDLLREMGKAQDRSDHSHWDLPSISPHAQNRGFRDWVSLIELLRDAWLALCSLDSARATAVASFWFDRPYPAFKRLAFFAASCHTDIAPDQWVNWLVNDDAWWLWAVDVRREVLRLLVLQGHQLTATAQKLLENSILLGPPREMYREDLEPGRWQHITDQAIWLHLAKLQSSGLKLGVEAAARLGQLSLDNPRWGLKKNEQDEFSFWMSGTGDDDYEESFEVNIAPKKRRELVLWLKQPPPDRQTFDRDTWREVCRKHLLNSLFALSDLAEEGVWPIGRWREALHAWSTKELAKRSWRYACPIIQTMPDAIMQELAHSLTHWLETISKAPLEQEQVFFALCKRVLDLPLRAESGMTKNGAPINEPVSEAINHPVGHITQALLNRWFKRGLNDRTRLAEEFSTFFTMLSDTDVDRFRHARVILLSNLIALFRVDQPWTEQHLLPLLSWANNPIEAKAAWEGFLWSPRLYRPLLIAIKPQLLETAGHYHDLNGHAQQFAGFFTYVALGPIDGYTVAELRTAIEALPQTGLEESAQALSQALEGAADQREEYWQNRVLPFWRDIWPKSRDRATVRIAEALSRMSLAAGNEFPAALAEVENWLCPLEHPHYVIHQLQESGLSDRFPASALHLLDLIIDDQNWASHGLEGCLNSITQADQHMIRDLRYQRLQQYVRRRGT